MKNFRTQRKKWLRRIWFLIIPLLVVFGILLYKGIRCIWTQVFIPINFNTENVESDDQRSTLWPMFVSLAITMLGSLITTYVFLKDALDQTLNEKPYYRIVVDEYRHETMKSLWRYAILTLVFIALTFALYFLFYFYDKRSPNFMRIPLFACYCMGMIISFYVLHKCIHIESGLYKKADKLLKKTLECSQDYSRNVWAIRTVLGLSKEKLAHWLQIENTSDESGHQIDAKKFVVRFSEWESLLLMLVKQDASTQHHYFQDEQLEFTIKRGMEAYMLGRDTPPIEWDDAIANGWYSTAICGAIRECEDVLYSSAEGLPNDKRLRKRMRSDNMQNIEMVDRFIDEFMFLAQCRDLLQSLMDLTLSYEDNVKLDQNWLFGYDDKLSDIFFSFLIGLSVAALRISPRIEAFSPAGRFVASDFYSVRFENSSFRASAFSRAIFARTKVKNSNFSLSKFQSCEFFSADLRNCSFSNTLFKNCFLRQAIFYDVDFTGARLEGCDLSAVSCHDSILLNMDLIKISLGQNDLTNCKIESIHFQQLPRDAKGQVSMRNMNLSNSTVSKIFLDLEDRPAPTNYNFHDSISQVLQMSISSSAIQCAFCSEQRQENYFFVAMNSFYLESGPIPFRSIASKARNNIPAHPVWTDIQKMTFISMQECVFAGTMMVAIQFYRTDLEQSVFQEAQMDEANFFCVYMLGCIMTGANLRESRLWAVVLQSAILEEAIFFKANCKLVNFEDGALQHLHASEAKFQYCSFNRSDCKYIDLTRAEVSDSLFWDSILSEAELTGAQFRSVQFDNSVADHMLASYTLFQECSLSNAYLVGSNFNYTTFEDCDFRLANFSHSIVTNAVFRRCDFSGSNFKETVFIGLVLENCSHLESAKFDHCQFISSRFCGTTSDFEEQLKEQNATIYELEEL